MGGDGAYYIRPTIHGSRTWRKLSAIKQREALIEGRAILAAQHQARVGLAKDPFAPGDCSLGELAAAYIEAGCPDRRLMPRPESFVEGETKRLANIVAFFGKMPASQIRLSHTHDFYKWRTARITKGKGNRTVDLELCGLSNVCNYGVATQRLDFNYVRNRQRFVAAKEIRHCREAMPASGDELNRVADALFLCQPSESLGWQCLIEAMTGLRTHEALMLRMDAKPTEPGYVNGEWLHVHRGKRGMFPVVRLHDDLRECISAHHRWHATRYPDSRWWFPGRDGVTPVHTTSLPHALKAVCRELGIRPFTSHGLRAFFVTLHRRAGFRDEEVAQLIGDRSVALIHQTYGERAVGEAPLSWRPSTGDPAWKRWLPIVQ